MLRSILRSLKVTTYQFTFHNVRMPSLTHFIQDTVCKWLSHRAPLRFWTIQKSIQKRKSTCHYLFTTTLQTRWNNVFIQPKFQLQGNDSKSSSTVLCSWILRGILILERALLWATLANSGAFGSFRVRTYTPSSNQTCQLTQLFVQCFTPRR